MALTITDGNITEILSNNKIVVLDFWAIWCGPCKALGGIIEQLAAENTDVVIGKMNVDENMITPVKHAIRAIPTVILFKDGVEVDKFSGVRTKAEIQERINKLK